MLPRPPCSISMDSISSVHCVRRSIFLVCHASMVQSSRLFVSSDEHGLKNLLRRQSACDGSLYFTSKYGVVMGCLLCRRFGSRMALLHASAISTGDLSCLSLHVQASVIVFYCVIQPPGLLWPLFVICYRTSRGLVSL